MSIFKHALGSLFMVAALIASASTIAGAGETRMSVASIAPASPKLDIGRFLKAAQTVKTCYACGLCTEVSCCGSGAYFLEDCTTAQGVAAKKCCINQ